MYIYVYLDICVEQIHLHICGYTWICVYVYAQIHTYTHTHAHSFLIHAREFQRKFGTSRYWMGKPKRSQDGFHRPTEINSDSSRFCFEWWVGLGGLFFFSSVLLLRGKNHDLTRIRRRMLNHCESTNETHLHSSKQLPLIHGGDWLHQESQNCKSPWLLGTTSCVSIHAGRFFTLLIQQTANRTQQSKQLQHQRK